MLRKLKVPELVCDPVLALKKAMRLLSNPARWLKGREAVDGAGLTTEARNVNAVRFCAHGAARRFSDVSCRYLDEACQMLEICSINDNSKTSHAKIMRKFRHAIRLAKKATK